MCRALKVTRQGYHAWRRNEVNRLKRERAEKELINKIWDEFHKSHRTYGRVRITKELQMQGFVINKKKVRRLMKENGIIPKAAKKFKNTTNSKHSYPVAENLLDRDFSASEPNEKLVGDITAIWTEEGWLFLAVIIDLFQRKVLGWSLKDTMTSELVEHAFIMAMKKAGIKKIGIKNNSQGGSKKRISHSDRGTQYSSYVNQNLLESFGYTCSMSRKGNCWDNAVAESFFHSLKVEAIYGEKFRTRDEARRAVFDWIECFYNKNRRHSALGYLTITEFEQQQLEFPLAA